MRRLARILLNAATCVSLVLFVATAVLWVRGYVVVDKIQWRTNTVAPNGEYRSVGPIVGSARGQLFKGFVRVVSDKPVAIDEPTKRVH